MAALSSFAMLAPGAKPLEPFGKGSNALKAGTPDAGPLGPTASLEAAVRSAPGRGERKPEIYAASRETQAERAATLKRPARSALRLLNELGKPHCKLDGLAH